MYVRNIKLTDIWHHENLGISNPTLEESKQNSYENALDDFQQKLSILPNGSVNNVKEQENFIDIASKLLSKGCFNLRGWQSNVTCKYVSQHTGEASVLGMLWNLDKDTLRCNINFEILTCETKITKRFILSIVQKVFDANGLLSPATLPPKLLLQETWKLDLPWDSELPKSIVNKFMKWANEMYLLKEVTMPRYIAINETSELHIFVDASKSSYGACVFVRTIAENDVKVTLLRSKARVAHLKYLTIPRLELMSCCIGARLANSIIRALNLPGIKSWRHVPSNMNIADLLSRGCTPQKMLDSKWWEGPLWLKNNREQWPANEINCEPKDVILEKRKSELVNVNISEELVPWVHVEERKLSELSSDDIENAERVLIRLVQDMMFPNLKSISIVNVFKDNEGIIRVKTKITERKDDPNFIAPILMPRFCEGNTRNKWRDGQVCPDVDKELWRLGPDGSETGGKGEKREQREKEKKSPGERTDGRRRRDGKRERERRKETERESGRERVMPALNGKNMSPEIGEKKRR
ncbi:integrase_H2C2 domain-containing protein [Trichonephila clavipes]|nr:integrase_H2C2 domain-containing protein [Trichonephila clavipes]